MVVHPGEQTAQRDCVISRLSATLQGINLTLIVYFSSIISLTISPSLFFFFFLLLFSLVQFYCVMFNATGHKCMSSSSLDKPVLKRHSQCFLLAFLCMMLFGSIFNGIFAAASSWGRVLRGASVLSLGWSDVLTQEREYFFPPHLHTWVLYTQWNLFTPPLLTCGHWPVFDAEGLTYMPQDLYDAWISPLAFSPHEDQRKMIHLPNLLSDLFPECTSFRPWSLNCYSDSLAHF